MKIKIKKIFAKDFWQKIIKNKQALLFIVIALLLLTVLNVSVLVGAFWYNHQVQNANMMYYKKAVQAEMAERNSNEISNVGSTATEKRLLSDYQNSRKNAVENSYNKSKNCDYLVILFKIIFLIILFIASFGMLFKAFKGLREAREFKRKNIPSRKIKLQVKTRPRAVKTQRTLRVQKRKTK